MGVSMCGPRILAILGLLAAVGLSSGAQAKDAKQIQLDLNALQDSDKGCIGVFVLKNALGQDVAKLGIRIASFSPDGHVSPLTTLSVAPFATNKTRVVTALLTSAQPCSRVGRVLVDSVSVCDGDGLDPGMCGGMLSLSTHAAVSLDY